MPTHTPRHALAACTWLAAVISLGPWSAHLLYNGGLALADVSRRKPINAPIDWLATLCQQTSFAEVHRFSMATIALLAFLPFLRPLLRKPNGWLLMEWNAARDDIHGPRQAMIAATLCFILATLMALLLDAPSGISIPTRWFRHLIASCILALAAETLFRGIIQRAFSHSFGTKHAPIATAAAYLLFLTALLPHGIDHWTPELSSDRFPLLRAVASSLSDPSCLLHQSVPLLLLGIALSWARSHSRSLWLVTGIQTGILMSRTTTTHHLPALLAALASIYVLCGRPSLRNPTP